MKLCISVWMFEGSDSKIDFRNPQKKLRLHHQPLGTYSIKYDIDIQSHLIYSSNCCIYTNIPNIFENQWKTRSARTPTFWEYPPPPHDYPYHWFISDPKSKDDKVKVTKLKYLPKWKKNNTRHTIWSFFIRCVNMKWTRLVLWKIQSGPHLFYRRTDGRTDRRTKWIQYTPPPPPLNFVAGVIKIMVCQDINLSINGSMDQQPRKI